MYMGFDAPCAHTVQDCFEMRCVGSSTEGLPPGVEAIPGPRTQRQVRTSEQLVIRLPSA